MPIDLSRLSPGDAVAALRSYQRRFRTALAPIDDDENVEAAAHEEGPDGVSAVEAVAGAVRTWRILADALQQIRVADTPIVPRAVVDPGERTWEAPVDETVASVLDQLDQQTSELADAAGAFSGEQWNRTAEVSGGGTVTALDVVKEAVRVGHDSLDVVERTLASARR